MREVRPQTAVRVPAHAEPHELVDELAHAHVTQPIEPRQIEIIEREQIEREQIEEGRVDQPWLPSIDRDGGQGGSQSDERGEPEQFVFVDGAPVLTNGGGRPVAEGIFDAAALGRGFASGGLDLVADGGLVRMVLNGRLRLSALGARSDRRAAAALLAASGRAAPVDVERPYGPVHLRFDLGAKRIPGALAGRTFDEVREQMTRAIESGDEAELARLSGALADAHAFLASVAEIAPDLSFADLKLLFADFATPAIAAHGHAGRVDARRFVRVWQRLDAVGDVKARDAVADLSPAQLRFLVANAQGQVLGDDDAAQIAGPRREEVRDAAVHFTRMRVLGAELWRGIEARAERLDMLGRRPIPPRVVLAGDASFAAAVFALARRRDVDPRFEGYVVNGVRHGEDPRGPHADTSLGVRLSLEQLEVFAKVAHPQEGVGLVDRLESADPFVQASVDPYAAALHASLVADGVQGGLLQATSEEAVVSKVFDAPVHAEVPDTLQRLRTLAARGAPIVLHAEGRREPVATLGTAYLFDVPVGPEALALVTARPANRDGLTSALTRLANTIERAGRPVQEVDVLLDLKSRANRPSGDTLDAIVDATLDVLRAHVDVRDTDEHVTPVAVAIREDGTPRIVSAADFELTAFVTDARRTS
ncbi:MAG: hypothetical protein RMA76_17960 [Deltaproteobacteria bacterium]|jgi:hypothetical protein